MRGPHHIMRGDAHKLSAIDSEDRKTDSKENEQKNAGLKRSLSER